MIFSLTTSFKMEIWRVLNSVLVVVKFTQLTIGSMMGRDALLRWKIEEWTEEVFAMINLMLNNVQVLNLQFNTFKTVLLPNLDNETSSCFAIRMSLSSCLALFILLTFVILITFFYTN